MQNLIRSEIMQHLEFNSTLSDTQYNFLTGGLRMLQLLKELNKWKQALEAVKSDGVIHLILGIIS